MVIWSENEAIFLQKPYLSTKSWGLKVKLYLATFSILGLAIVEHLLAKFSQFGLIEREIQFCNYTVENRFLFNGERDFRNFFELFPAKGVTGVCFYV